MLILHLSDIHFRKMEVATKQDPNHHLRNELVRDIEATRGKIGTNPDVILISGDIAFAGDKDEYEFATKWLAELCEKIDAPMSLAASVRDRAVVGISRVSLPCG